MKSLFGAHETFHIREGWLRKGLLAIKENPFLFSDPYAGDVLGVGRNMVKSIRYWLQATGLAKLSSGVQEGKKVAKLDMTGLAELILKKDPYFEDDGTFWILHYHLATNKALATTWYWFFNHFGIRQFTQDQFLSHLERYAHGDLGRKVQVSTLEKDFRCLVRTYTRWEETGRPYEFEDNFDCPFASLNLLQKLPTSKTYKLINPNPQSLSPLLVGYALINMRQNIPLYKREASLRDAQYEPQSPGRVFVLDTEMLYEYLIALDKEHSDLLSFSRTAGLNLIMFKPLGDPLDVLKRYYRVGAKLGFSYA